MLRPRPGTGPKSTRIHTSCLSIDNGGAKSRILKKVERKEGKHVRRVTFPAIWQRRKETILYSGPTRPFIPPSTILHHQADATRYPPDNLHHVHGSGRPHAHSALGRGAYGRRNVSLAPPRCLVAPLLTWCRLQHLLLRMRCAHRRRHQHQRPLL